MRSLLGLLALACAPGMSFAQVGRVFTPAEGFVALAETVRVGRIVSLERIEYSQELVGEQVLGKPYRMVFQVRETIRGKDAKMVELVLSLQHSHMLDYMRDHKSEVLLAGSANRIDSDPDPEVGIEEDGKRVDGHWYHFRFLETPPKTDKNTIERQINITYNEGKMFTFDLKVIRGRDAILKRMREFAKKHKETVEAVYLRVPNDFASLVGYPNAFAKVRLPACAETERTLVSLLKDPDLIFGRIGPQPEFERDATLGSAIQCLKPFKNEANASLVRGFLEGFAPKEGENLVESRAKRTQKAAWLLLKEWGMELPPLPASWESFGSARTNPRFP
ncbi:MAG: hypothetical protein D8M22_04755 [Armatimonadetes bacterium]|nr:hypothetical protein [Armatimonadota bacterium]